ncbi:MAG TPA: DUF362 domain-containing protein [Candidatus Anoxymicrobiaceae bacterium]|jgi:uncharacterized Fe-S center protein
MAKSEVFLADMRALPKRNLEAKVRSLLARAGFDGLDLAKKFVAIKIHFGEPGNLAFIRPNYAALVAQMVRDAGGKPFLTDTNSLYTGSRANAVDHLAAAASNGFNSLTVGCEVMIADGLKGIDYREIEVDQKHTDVAKIGSCIADADAIITLNHFKGHELTGIGGAVKNLGMGCAARGGKLYLHSSSKPRIDVNKCVACGTCVESCSQAAIFFNTAKRAEIDYDKCVGCGQCIAMCQYGAASAVFNESASNAAEKIAEYALAVLKGKPAVHASFITDVSPFCDCWGYNDMAIVADIGFAASSDPVALDRACTDLVNDAPVNGGSMIDGRGLKPGDDKFSSVHPNTSWRAGLAYAESIGLGSQSYEIVKVD